MSARKEQGLNIMSSFKNQLYPLCLALVKFGAQQEDKIWHLKIGSDAILVSLFTKYVLLLKITPGL